MIAALRGLPVAGVLLGLAALFALLLALPGETVTTVYVNDLFIFLDGAHRVASGQVPNRDFHTALGPLVYTLPALGYWLTGSLGGAMPLAMAIFVLTLAPAAAHVIGSRLRPVVALPAGAFILLVAAVPMNLGESVASLSFAMFYNRMGWAALAVLLLMYLRPLRDRPGQGILDTLCATGLTVAMLYTKVTYGLVGLAFLAFMLLDPRQRRWAFQALVLTLAAAFAVELVWRSSAAHLADLVLTGNVSGLRGVIDLAHGFLRHIADYTLFGIFAALVLWRTRSLRDLLFFGFCAGPGLLVMAQNSQPWGIITLHAGAAVAAERLLRLEERPPADAAAPGGRHWSLASGSPLLLLALLLPTILHCFAALALHAGLAAARFGEPFGLPRFQGIRLAELWSPGDHPFSVAYLTSVRNGARALEGLDREPARVSVLDFANPFSAGLGLKPPAGDNSWLHWERNVNAEHFIPPEQLFRDVEVLMVPKWGINTLPLQGLYGGYVRTAFRPARENEAWTVYLRRDPAAPGESPDPQARPEAGATGSRASGPREGRVTETPSSGPFGRGREGGGDMRQEPERVSRVWGWRPNS